MGKFEDVPENGLKWSVFEGECMEGMKWGVSAESTDLWGDIERGEKIVINLTEFEKMKKFDIQSNYIYVL